MHTTLPRNIMLGLCSSFFFIELLEGICVIGNVWSITHSTIFHFSIYKFKIAFFLQWEKFFFVWPRKSFYWKNYYSKSRLAEQNRKIKKIQLHEEVNIVWNSTIRFWVICECTYITESTTHLYTIPSKLEAYKVSYEMFTKLITNLKWVGFSKDVTCSSKSFLVSSNWRREESYFET